VEGRRTGAGSWLSFGGLEVGNVQLRLAANLNIRGVITLGVSMSSSLEEPNLPCAWQIYSPVHFDAVSR